MLGVHVVKMKKRFLMMEAAFSYEEKNEEGEKIMSEVDNKTKNAVENEPENKEENDLVIRFKKPFPFEEKQYSEVDLSGLENLTGNDMIEVERLLRVEGFTGLSSDLSPKGLMIYAMRASKLPIEFFEQLPLREARKVKTRVLNFFLE